eukprot:Skav207841  [mRNA]  locus=scaffold3025:170845:171844:+ [translate_table: standard]
MDTAGGLVEVVAHKLANPFESEGLFDCVSRDAREIAAAIRSKSSKENGPTSMIEAVQCLNMCYESRHVAGSPSNLVNINGLGGAGKFSPALVAASAHMTAIALAEIERSISFGGDEDNLAEISKWELECASRVSLALEGEPVLSRSNTNFACIGEMSTESIYEVCVRPSMSGDGALRGTPEQLRALALRHTSNLPGRVSLHLALQSGLDPDVKKSLGESAPWVLSGGETPGTCNHYGGSHVTSVGPVDSSVPLDWLINVGVGLVDQIDHELIIVIS